MFLSLRSHPPSFFFFFFNDTATTEIYTLSLHDALPISVRPAASAESPARTSFRQYWRSRSEELRSKRSEEHTSELQSLAYLVCRLLLEKKKKQTPSGPHKYRPNRTTNNSILYSSHSMWY